MYTKRCRLTALSLLLPAGLVLAACGGGGSSSETDTTWSGYSYSNTVQTSYYKVLAGLGKDFSAATDGAVDMKMHPGGSLGIDATNITQAVANNSVQFADDGFYQGNVPIAGILSLPLLYVSLDDVQRAVDASLPAITDAMQKSGVELLGYYIYPPQTLFTKMPVTSLADMKGLKLRTSGPQQAALVQALGAQPITIGTPEVAPALQQGVIDGVFTAGAGGATAYSELVPHNYRLPANWVVSLTLVNSKAFAKLSSETQKAIKDVVDEKVTKGITPKLAVEEEEAMKKYKNEGMVVTEPTAEDVQRAQDLIRGYWRKWAEEQGAAVQDLLNGIQQNAG